MAIKLNISNTFQYKVAGTYATETGANQAFEFHLVARRLGQPALADQLPKVVQGDVGMDEFLAGVVTGWTGVLDDEDKLVPYSPEALKVLFNSVPGASGLAFAGYCEYVRVRAKN